MCASSPYIMSFKEKKILVISNQEGSGAVYFYWHAEWKCPDRNTDGNML